MSEPGITVGDVKIEVSHEAIYSKLLELEAMLAPLVPHIPAVVAMLDNPAVRWKARRSARGD